MEVLAAVQSLNQRHALTRATPTSDQGAHAAKNATSKLGKPTTQSLNSSATCTHNLLMTRRCMCRAQNTEFLDRQKSWHKQQAPKDKLLHV